MHCRAAWLRGVLQSSDRCTPVAAVYYLLSCCMKTTSHRLSVFVELKTLA